ncbi:MAG: hypothetical protein ACR2FY_11480 [Pirellulaceae bacterium]
MAEDRRRERETLARPLSGGEEGMEQARLAEPGNETDVGDE